MRQNLFVAFEGIDGSGKSTQVKLLGQRLKAEGHSVHLTSEPTTGPIGSLIRKIFSHELEADHRTIAGLFVADRLEHLLNTENGILKKMQEGSTVICDRYCFSSYAYNGVHVSLDWVITANSLSTELLRPHRNIFIDVEPELAMERIRLGREARELYETLDNLKVVRDKYFEAFERLKNEEKVIVIDGNRSPEIIAVDIWSSLSEI